jgi:hypothetical protein
VLLAGCVPDDAPAGGDGPTAPATEGADNPFDY